MIFPIASQITLTNRSDEQVEKVLSMAAPSTKPDLFQRS